MDRREFFCTGSVLLTAGIAGCSGVLGGGDDADDTTGRGETTVTPTATASRTASPATDTPSKPQFEVELSANRSTRVHEDLTVGVTVTNSGGRSGSFSDTLRVTGPTTRTAAVELGEIPPDTRRSTSVTFSFEYAGQYTVTLEDRPVESGLRVAPITEYGSTVSVGDDVAFTVGSIAVEPAVLLTGPGWGYRRNPVSGIVGARNDDPNGWFVAIVRGRVDNAGSTPVEFDPSLIDIRADSGTKLPVNGGETSSTGIEFADARLPDGTPNLSKTVIDPGESVEGFLLAPVNRYLAGSSVSAVVQRDDRSMPEATWKNLPAGRRRRLPEFEVRNLSVPGEVEIGTEREFSVTVENVGDAPGSFRGLLRDHVWGEKYTPLGTVGDRIGPGESKRLTGTLICPWSRERDVVFDPGGLTGTIQARKATRPYGESYTMPNGVTVKIFSPVYSDSVQYGDERWSWGMWTVIVEAELPEEATGEGRGRELLPSLEEFRCHRNNDSFPYTNPLRVEKGRALEDARKNGNSLVNPVSGDLYPANLPKDPDDGTVGGWVTFEIGPDDYHFDLDRLEVQLLRNVFGEYDHLKSGWSKKYSII